MSYWDEGYKEDKDIEKEIKKHIFHAEELDKLILILYNKGKNFRDSIAHSILRTEGKNLIRWDPEKKDKTYQEFSDIKKKLGFFLTMCFLLLDIDIPDDLTKRIFVFFN